MGIRDTSRDAQHWITVRARTYATVAKTGKPHIFKFAGDWYVLSWHYADALHAAAIKFVIELNSRDEQNTP